MRYLIPIGGLAVIAAVTGGGAVAVREGALSPLGYVVAMGIFGVVASAGLRAAHWQLRRRRGSR